MLKKVLADSNMAIQICGIRMARALAAGLRKTFSHGAKVLSPLLIGKLRDKKNQITDEAHKALKAMLYAVSLEDILDSIKEGLTDKAPNMRQQTLKLVQSSITKKDGKTVRSLMDTLLKLTTDGAAEVRDKVIEVIADVKNLFGSGFIGDKFKDVQSQKLQKILSEKNEVMPVDSFESLQQPTQRAVSVEPKPQYLQKKQLKTSSLQSQPPQTQVASRSLEPAANEDSLTQSRPL